MGVSIFVMLLVLFAFYTFIMSVGPSRPKPLKRYEDRPKPEYLNHLGEEVYPKKEPVRQKRKRSRSSKVMFISDNDDFEV